MLQKHPVISIIKWFVPAAVASTKEGIEAIVVDEVKREDIGDVIEYHCRFLTEFRNIDGFRYFIRTFNTVSEAISNIGMG